MHDNPPCLGCTGCFSVWSCRGCEVLLKNCSSRCDGGTLAVVTEAAEWLSTPLSPWPREGFGLERMRKLLAELGDPQLTYPAIHVVGTNGKSTATVTIEQLLLSEGRSVGSTISPHVVGWSERIRIGRCRSRLRARGGARPEGRRAAHCDPVRDRDRCGARRLCRCPRWTSRWSRPGSAAASTRRTSFIRGSSCWTSVGLEHARRARWYPRGDRTREARCRAAGRHRRPPRRDPTHIWFRQVRFGSAAPVRPRRRSSASGLLAEPNVELPGRLEQRGPSEVRDGAHNPDGARYLVERLPLW